MIFQTVGLCIFHGSAEQQSSWSQMSWGASTVESVGSCVAWWICLARTGTVKTCCIITNMKLWTDSMCEEAKCREGTQTKSQQTTWDWAVVEQNGKQRLSNWSWLKVLQRALSLLRSTEVLIDSGSQFPYTQFDSQFVSEIFRWPHEPSLIPA